MKKRIKQRGITFKYMKDYDGHHVYGFLNRRILADDFGHITHEFISPQNDGENWQRKKKPGRKAFLTLSRQATKGSCLINTGAFIN